MPADRAKFPVLELVGIGKGPTVRAPYYEVHGKG
jgi:hypothetical protein